MKKNIVKVLFAVFSVAFLGWLYTGNTFAEVLPSLIVSPVNKRIIINPGEVYHGSVSVSNRYDADSNLKFEVLAGSFSQLEDETHHDDYGTVDHISVSSWNQIKDWIEFEFTSGEVVPNGEVVVPYTITVPEDAPAGGQYATIIIRDVSHSLDNNQSGITIQNEFQFASVVYAEVAGETRDTGEILENNAPSFLLDGSKFEATSMVKNTGNVHTDAEYILQVWPLFSGEEICTNEENPDTSLILPDTKRYHSQKCELPSFGIFNIKQTVKIFDQVSTIEKMVIVCPIWLLFLIIFLVALGIIYLFARSKKRKND